MSEHKVQYFLGANAPDGFYSLYPELIDLERARAVYILKGGRAPLPGQTARLRGKYPVESAERPGKQELQSVTMES